MITIKQNGCCFNYRVAGVAFRDDEVLLHKSEPDDFWTLPGGRVEMGESSEAALKRELQEELAVKVEVMRMVLVVENFFEYEHLAYHEVGFYYQMSLPNDCLAMTAHERFRGWEGNVVLEFQWFKLSELHLIRLLPRFLVESLQSLPCDPVHIVHSDRCSTGRCSLDATRLDRT